MDFNDYQEAANKTDRNPLSDGDDILSKPYAIPLFGLAGEAGSLLAEYKKLLRDGSAHERFVEEVREDLGDLLWYIANIATKFGLSLEDVAATNLKKTQRRWSPVATPPSFLDEKYPESERLPRTFSYLLREEDHDGRQRAVLRDVGDRGQQVGNALTDNAYIDDGYRYHDVLHLAFAALLGWSPVLRRLRRSKRKSSEEVDDVEDGARAAAIEEMIAALVGTYALRHKFLEGTTTVDASLLKTIKLLTENLEVSVRTEAEWEAAIVRGIQIWKQLYTRGGGIVIGDMALRTLDFKEA